MIKRKLRLESQILQGFEGLLREKNKHAYLFMTSLVLVNDGKGNNLQGFFKKCTLSVRKHIGYTVLSSHLTCEFPFVFIPSYFSAILFSNI
jgi:hypothetical protein